MAINNLPLNYEIFIALPLNYENHFLGNPTTYYNGMSYNFTWEGRRLVGATQVGTSTYNIYSFTYNADGIRTSKTVNGVEHKYYLDGTRIVAEEWGNNLLMYMYDPSGSPLGMMYRTTSYASGTFDIFWFERNLQGDIIAVYNNAGTRLVEYTYDAWGWCATTYWHGGANTVARYNPFRYRGYYYDSDLEMYYLQSRYYDPNVARFISPDDIGYLGANGDLTSYNLYAYCSNNPVMYSDPSGHVVISTILICAGIGLLAGFGATLYADYKDDGEVFNDSVDAVDYVVNSLIGTTAGAFIGAAVPYISGFMSSSFAVPVLASGASVTVTGAQVVGATALAAGLTFFANRSGKEMSSEHPSWVNKDMVDPNLSAQQNAKNMLNNRYGPGNWRQGPKTEYNQIVKWIARKLFYGR